MRRNGMLVVLAVVAACSGKPTPDTSGSTGSGGSGGSSGTGGSGGEAGSGGTSGSGCHVDVTGDIAISEDCTALAMSGSESGGTAFVELLAGSTTAVVGGFRFPGVVLTTGTFQQGDSALTSGEVAVVNQTSTGDATWVASAGTAYYADGGTFTLTISSTGAPHSYGSGTSWPDVHGSLTATCPALAGSLASGEADVSATF